jgi:DNA modification methylase
VLDAFAGSGTTLVAAHKAGRRGYGIELDPHYCDVILRRMAGIAKHDAILVATGQTFAAVAAERGDAGEVDHGEVQDAQVVAAEAAE